MDTKINLTFEEFDSILKNAYTHHGFYQVKNLDINDACKNLIMLRNGSMEIGLWADGDEKFFVLMLDISLELKNHYLKIREYGIAYHTYQSPTLNIKTKEELFDLAKEMSLV